MPAKPRAEVTSQRTCAIDAIDWPAAEEAIQSDGYATIASLLSDEQCAQCIAMYPRDELFRKRVDMGRHAFGSGDYAYFDEPLPGLVQQLQTTLYERLAPVADRMNEALRRDDRFPPTLDEYREICRDAGQARPTPLLLRYGAGGYNRLHRDLYGPLVFPLQMTVLLSRPRSDFGGGEFLLVENLPRRQARGDVVALDRGDAVIFPVNERPVAGARGSIRASMRHGVSKITAGERYALGIIFHGA